MHVDPGPQVVGCSARIRRVQHTARDRHNHARVLRATAVLGASTVLLTAPVRGGIGNGHACLQRSIQVAALCPHTRHEQPAVRRQAPHGLQGTRLGRADDKSKLFPAPPVLPLPDDLLVERRCAVMLYLHCRGVRCVAEQKDRLVLIRQEGKDAVLSQVRAHGDGVGAQNLKRRAGIGLGRIADIPPFGVQEDGNALGNGRDDVAEGGQPLGARLFKEGYIRLVAADQIRRELDNVATESQHPRAFGEAGMKSDRHPAHVRIQPNAKQRVVLVNR